VRIGVLTGGGDVPGLNAAIRAVVKHAEINLGFEVVGIRNGWKGALEGDFFDLTRTLVRGITDRGGTILGSSRFHPHEHAGAMQTILKNFSQHNIDAIICIGGDGTLNAAWEMGQAGCRIVGIPKTIDNDVYGTEYSIGFDTAVEVATQAIDRLHTTAESHNRVALIEVMGRDHGWIAACAGTAGGADFIILPERPFSVDNLIKHIQLRHQRHASYSIVVVAEGAKTSSDSKFTYPQDQTHLSHSVSDNIMREITFRTHYDVFLTVLGHVQRGGTPSAFDRILASRFGLAAVEAIAAKKFGTVTTLQTGQIKLVPFSDIAGKNQAVPDELIEAANLLS
jgi:6-phosphofructokinase 1